jgi:hypothetical protein
VNGVQDLFESLQSQLVVSLSGHRKVLSHPGAKGDASELDWIAMLKDHLPSRYQVSKGFVIDYQGQRSEQIDIVVYDRQYTPLLFNQQSQLFIPAESVYGVLEVKQTLDSKNISYAGSKAASVRALERTSASIVHAGGTHDPRDLSPIIAGILALESSWSPPFGDSFNQILARADIAEQIDLGCAVMDGSFEVQYGDNGAISLKTCDSTISLSYFFFTLLSRLQAIGTVPAIDYGRYLAAIGDCT